MFSQKQHSSPIILKCVYLTTLDNFTSVLFVADMLVFLQLQILEFKLVSDKFLIAADFPGFSFTDL